MKAADKHDMNESDPNVHSAEPHLGGLSVIQGQTLQPAYLAEQRIFGRWHADPSQKVLQNGDHWISAVHRRDKRQQGFTNLHAADKKLMLTKSECQGNLIESMPLISNGCP